MRVTPKQILHGNPASVAMRPMAEGLIVQPSRLEVSPGNAMPQWRTEELTIKRAVPILARGMCLFDQPGVSDCGFQRETIFWRVLKRDWVSVRWVTVAPYNFGLVQLRNDVLPAIPKKVWPFPPPQVRQFKLVVHWSEVTEELGRELFVFCSAIGQEDVVLSWPLFTREQTYPGYAWTRKAREAYEKRNQRA